MTFFLGEDYQELTQREENDLEYMISQTENAISNIETFTEQLSKDLSVLDGVIHEVIYSVWLFENNHSIQQNGSLIDNLVTQHMWQQSQDKIR